MRNSSTCLLCKKPLKPFIFWASFGTQPIYGYQGNGFFCTLRHGYLFGIATARALTSTESGTEPSEKEN